ncbi:MAG: type IV secretion system protein [Legionella sp.]|nr:type IV secretion system protein [Legionella sp.]
MTLSPENFINDLLNLVDTITGHFVQRGYQAITDDLKVSGLLSAIFLLYVVYQLVQVYYEQAAFSDTSKHLMKLFIVLALALNWDVFHRVIYNVVTNEPMHISKVLTTAYGQGSGGSSASLNDVWAKGSALTVALIHNLPFSPRGLFLGILAALMVFVSTLFFTMIALCYLVMAKFFVAIYLAIAPYFILMFLFRGTQGLTQAWIQSLLNYMLVPVFVSVVLLLTMSLAVVLLDPMNAQGTGPGFPGCLMYFVAGLLSAYITYLVPQKAAALTSSLSLGALSQAGSHARSLLGHAGKGAQAVGGGIKQGTKNAVQQFKAREQRLANERSLRSLNS